MNLDLIERNDGVAIGKNDVRKKNKINIWVDDFDWEQGKL